MDEQTVNEAPLFDASDIEPVANDSVEEQAIEDMGSSAVEETTEQTTSEDNATEEPAASIEEETQTGDAIDEFLSKKGIKSDDPDALRKLADMYQNVEKGFYNKSQENAQLQRRLAEQRVPESNPNQEALSEVRAMRIEMEANKWKQDRNLSPADEQKMIEYITAPLKDAKGNDVTDPATGTVLTRGLLVNNGALSLDDVYKLAGCGSIEVDNLKEDLKNEVKKEMEARLAAKRPSSNATDSTQFSKAEENDPFASALLGD